MKPSVKGIAVSAIALAVAQASYGGTDPYFTPLTSSGTVEEPNNFDELNGPWDVPAGVVQTPLTSMAEIESAVDQTTQRVNAGNVSSMWDMVAYDPSGQHIFIPHETPWGAGITRYDVETDKATLIFAGDGNGEGGDWSYDYGAFDPARFTPNGTVIGGEEWAGTGRVVEIRDPWHLGDPKIASAEGKDQVGGYRELPIPRVSHEGILFDESNEVIYFVDENRSGSIYKQVLNEKGNYVGGGTTYVLVVDRFKGDVTARVDREPNNDPKISKTRFGMASWVAITDSDGNFLDPGVDTNGSRPGRQAADLADGTPFGRPEDAEFGVLNNGNKVIYVATTSENSVISIELLNNDRAQVRSFVNPDTPTNLGFAPTTGTLSAPDNLAVDSLGNIYVIEDSPNKPFSDGVNAGGDIWFARDKNNDGVAESIDHFMALQVSKAEATGMIFNPSSPAKFVVAVQHPESTAITATNPDGHTGDALWEFNVESIYPDADGNGVID